MILCHHGVSNSLPYPVPAGSGTTARQGIYAFPGAGARASDRDRTGDLPFTRRMLCQLSYRGVLCVCLVFIVYTWFCVCQICDTTSFSSVGFLSRAPSDTPGRWLFHQVFYSTTRCAMMSNRCGVVRQAPGVEPGPAVLETATLPLRYAAKVE